MKYKIEFEDQGQDFLAWVIDTTLKKVVDCSPFQRSMWVGLRCKQKAFNIGGKVSFIDRDGQRKQVKYPIVKVEAI